MPSDNSKVPGQVFAWFEKMKGNYEKNLATMMERFERNVDKQNVRIDTQNLAHIEELKINYKQQLNDKNQTVEYLNSEIDFYKQQVFKQQEMLEQLNSRYDAVMHTLLSEKKQISNLKEVVSSEHNQTSSETHHTDTAEQEKCNQDSLDQKSLRDINITMGDIQAKETIENQDGLYDTAMDLRRNGDHENAFVLFEEGAKSGDIKSMGALARAYFLNEGVEENQLLGLSWLITAANLGYEPAIKKCEDFKRTSPELYEQSLALIEKL
jgi:TolA-binding protein